MILMIPIDPWVSKVEIADMWNIGPYRDDSTALTSREWGNEHPLASYVMLFHCFDSCAWIRSSPKKTSRSWRIRQHGPHGLPQMWWLPQFHPLPRWMVERNPCTTLVPQPTGSKKWFKHGQTTVFNWWFGFRNHPQYVWDCLIAKKSTSSSSWVLPNLPNTVCFARLIPFANGLQPVLIILPWPKRDNPVAEAEQFARWNSMFSSCLEHHLLAPFVQGETTVFPPVFKPQFSTGVSPPFLAMLKR